MDLHLTQDQSELVGLFADVFTTHCTPDDVEAAQESTPGGFSPTLWSHLVDVGALDMAVDSSSADGLSLLDLALVAEQHGRFVSPTPLIEAFVAIRLLQGLGRYDSTRLPTIAVRAAVADRCDLVPSATVADDAVILRGDELLLVALDGRRSEVDNLGHMALADVVLDDEAAVLASGAEAHRLFSRAVDEWRVLSAAALAGLSQRALEIGVDYVKVRKAFGQPVGQFQSVQHRLADRASEADGAELLAREAAWSAAVEPDRFSALAAMALAFAAETAIATSHDALHFHGGYGFMNEYPIQQYYRRARSWGAVLESPAEGYRLAADRQYGDQEGVA